MGAGVSPSELYALWQRLDPAARDLWLRAAAFAPQAVSTGLADACGLTAAARAQLAGLRIIDVDPDGAVRVTTEARAVAEQLDVDVDPDAAAARTSARAAFLDGVIARAGEIDLSTGGRIFNPDRAHFEMALSLLTEDAADAPRWVFLLDRIGTALHGQGELDPARDLLELALAMSVKLLSANHDLAIASRRYNLALVLLDVGELTRARDLLEQALATAAKHLSDDHPALVSLRTQLARAGEKLAATTTES
jgi:tetratricopeptide (TPR) repeat protein